MLEYVFNGMVFLILGLQLPGIISESLIRAENDPLVDTGSLLLDVIWIYLALMVVRLGWLWLMRLYSRKRPGKHPMLFAGYKTRHMLLATFAGVRGAITLAGVLSIPLLLPDGTSFRWFAALLFCRYYWGKMWGFSAITDKKKRKLPICLWLKWPY